MTQNEFEHIAKTIRAQAVNVSQCCGADSVGAEDIAQDTMLKLWMIHDTLSTTTHGADRSDTHCNR